MTKGFWSANATGAAKINPLASSQTITSASEQFFANVLIVNENACGSARRGEISLKAIHGVGKSLMVWIYGRMFMRKISK
jgi:hypothetical protein